MDFFKFKHSIISFVPLGVIFGGILPTTKMYGTFFVEPKILHENVWSKNSESRETGRKSISICKRRF